MTRTVDNSLAYSKNEYNPAVHNTVVLRRSSAYAFPNVSSSANETNIPRSTFDPVSRLMSSPPRSGSSSGYGTGSSRKSYSHHNNNVVIDNASVLHDKRSNTFIGSKEECSSSTTQYARKWYDDSTTSGNIQNVNYTKAQTSDGIHEGIETVHSSSSPMSSISDSSPSVSPEMVHPSGNMAVETTANKTENALTASPRSGILTGPAQIGSGKNSAFQRVVSSNRGNVDSERFPKDVKSTTFGSISVVSSASSASNSNTSSPQTSQPIYQPPAQLNQLPRSSSNKFLNTISNNSTVYCSSGGADQVGYNSQQQRSSSIHEKHLHLQYRRPLLKEERSNDAKVFSELLQKY